MKRLYFLQAVLIINVLFIASLYAANKTPSITKNPELPEIHLLVDVSGSMKKTDPQNLRAKAIKMFIYLIKQKALMDIDIYSTTAENIIPTRIVDNSFEKLYLKKRGQITSNGAWTNIELALKNANLAWKNSSNRVIVLLTDGKIDLGSDVVSAESKDRVINQLVQTLAAQKIRVFTVGFSDLADKDLLNKIAINTDGIPQIIRSSDDIDNTLYKIFTAVIPINGTAIEKNQNTTRMISIDKNIQHVTLIFKKNNTISEVYLTSPSGKKRSINEMSQANNNSVNYTFIDIDKPQIGKWLLSGPEQEVERAVVLTDVKLISSFASGVYFMQEHIAINNYLEEKGDLIIQPLVVDNLSMKLKMLNGSDQYAYTIPYAGKGQFSRMLYFKTPAGKYSLVVSAKNEYLSRELQFIVDLQPMPFKQTVDFNVINLELLHPDLIKSESVHINVLEDKAPVDIPITKKDLIWKLDFTDLCNQSSAKKITLNIDAKKNNDKDIQFKWSVLVSVICPVLDSQIESVPQVMTSVITAIKLPQKKTIPAANKKESRSVKYKYLIYILVLLVVLFFLSFLDWFVYSKKIKKIKNDLKNELAPDGTEELATENKNEQIPENKK
jgi:hypothetical protein